jgi:hypothetical protein
VDSPRSASQFNYEHTRICTLAAFVNDSNVGIALFDHGRIITFTIEVFWKTNQKARVYTLFYTHTPRIGLSKLSSAPIIAYTAYNTYWT